MSHLFQLNSVKYICCCGSLQPICYIYFCRHCLRLRCPYCVSHEVDSHYCGNCSENMPSAEAKQKKNRCGTCYDCPSCTQTLSIRATTIQLPSDEDPTKLLAKKLYYLACGFCRWTSRDASLADSTSTTGPWSEPESPFLKEIVHINDYLRVLALREKNLKEKKFVHKSKYLAAGRHGLAHLLPKRYPISTPDEMYRAIPPPEYVAESKGDDQFVELSDDFFEEEVNIAKITNLEQRLHQLETQPVETCCLLPTHKQLLVKRSLRCRVCERNISKPEYSPVSIKFKIQLNAFYHVPQIRMATPLTQPLNPGGTTTIMIKISNPTQFPTSIKFLSFSFIPLSKESVHDLTEMENPRESSTDISLPSNISTPSTSITIMSSPNVTPGTRNNNDASSSSQMIKEVHVLPIRNEKFINNCHLLNVPEAEVVVPPRDETSDFDDLADTPAFNDDPKLVPWRKANKAAVYLDIVRDKDSDPTDEPVLGLTIEYDYVNTIVALENKSGPQKVRLQTHVLISLNTSFSQ